MKKYASEPDKEKELCIAKAISKQWTDFWQKHDEDRRDGISQVSKKYWKKPLLMYGKPPTIKEKLDNNDLPISFFQAARVLSAKFNTSIEAIQQIPFDKHLFRLSDVERIEHEDFDVNIVASKGESLAANQKPGQTEGGEEVGNKQGQAGDTDNRKYLKRRSLIDQLSQFVNDKDKLLTLLKNAGDKPELKACMPTNGKGWYKIGVIHYLANHTRLLTENAMQAYSKHSVEGLLTESERSTKS